jgi:S1-C subfamily serine protease
MGVVRMTAGVLARNPIHNTPTLQETIRNALPAVVVIKSASTRGFDGEGALGGEATGFIVDLEQGLILTNRHVVTLGPVVASVSFYNKEEVGNPSAAPIACERPHSRTHTHK